MESEEERTGDEETPGEKHLQETIVAQGETDVLDCGLANQNFADQQVESQCALECEFELRASAAEQQDAEYLWPI